MPLDLHVLGPPLAFILSQDQTLHCKKLTGTSTLVWLPNICAFLFAFLGRRSPDRPPGFQYFQRTFLFFVTPRETNPDIPSLLLPTPPRRVRQFGAAKVTCLVSIFQIFFHLFFQSPLLPSSTVPLPSTPPSKELPRFIWECKGRHVFRSAKSFFIFFSDPPFLLIFPSSSMLTKPVRPFQRTSLSFDWECKGRHVNRTAKSYAHFYPPQIPYPLICNEKNLMRSAPEWAKTPRMPGYRSRGLLQAPTCRTGINR